MALRHFPKILISATQRYGEEASENARVWKLYRNRASELDNDQIEGWNKTLDILLIFVRTLL